MGKGNGFVVPRRAIFKKGQQLPVPIIFHDLRKRCPMSYKISSQQISLLIDQVGRCGAGGVTLYKAMEQFGFMLILKFFVIC